MPIVTEDLLDKELKALCRVGGYRSEQAAVGHALEVLLAANPALRLGVAVELYSTGDVTLARAAEIGGVSVETFQEHLQKKGMARTIDFLKEEGVAGAGWIDPYRQITVDLKNAVCVVTPITAKEYCDFSPQSLPICEDYSYYLLLDFQLKYKSPDFDHPHLYAALKTLFGESTTAYDDYKCSFGYQFLLKIIRKDKKSAYALSFVDIKGGISFMFRKILATPEELEKYKDKLLLHEPLEDDFSKDEMAHFMTWFVFYLKGFMQSFERHYHEEFARSLDYCFMIYGYRDNRFFLDQYEDQDEFYTDRSRMSKSGDIPFNRVKANE